MTSHWTPFLFKCFGACLIFAGAAEAQTLPDGPGKATLVKLCRECHDLDQATAKRQNKEGWKKTIDKMIDRGADGTDEEFEAVINYLSKYFDKINVNSASAKEMETGLDLSPKDAEAIVKHREENGKFKDWKDLMKVNGVDAKKIEARRDRITVQ